ncbi:MAG: hypothetical protein M9896_19280 [Candidatus Promineofilum sp.]|uniref:hypothetical protein n=1 Tax=Promineifilum sp. TaxID=2664178 RepID=UPI002411AD16|nr:hypothetical protein [Promineifilum sp.]
MALDIREGDVLVVGDREHPIRSCGEWAWNRSQASGMRRMCSVTAVTMRSPQVVDGKRGALATHLRNVRCMPLDPVEPDLAQRMALNTPHELLQTTVDGGDVFYSLVLEDLKR